MATVSSVLRLNLSQQNTDLGNTARTRRIKGAPNLFWESR
jgi:hypothetical protein